MITGIITSLVLTIHPIAVQADTTSQRDAALAALQLGLTPHRLAAVGVTGSQASNLLYTIEANALQRSELLDANRALRAAEREEHLLRARAESSTDSRIQSDHAAAVTALDTAQRRKAAALQAVVSILSIHAEVDTVMAACPPDGGEADLPGWAQIHLPGRGTSLACALRAEERATREREDLDDATAALLQSVRADAQCAASRSNEDANLRAVQAVFETAMFD